MDLSGARTPPRDPAKGVVGVSLSGSLRCRRVGPTPQENHQPPGKGRVTHQAVLVHTQLTPLAFLPVGVGVRVSPVAEPALCRGGRGNVTESDRLLLAQQPWHSHPGAGSSYQGPTATPAGQGGNDADGLPRGGLPAPQLAVTQGLRGAVRGSHTAAWKERQAVLIGM